MKTLKLLTKALLLVAFVFVFKNVNATKQSVSGTISSPVAMWSTDTVLITGNVIIDNSGKLTINPKTKVLFKGYYSITINGILRAVGGTGADTIRFSMLPADTTGFANHTLTNGAWAGFIINSSTSSSDSILFKYCKIEFIKKIDADPVAIDYASGYKLAFLNCFFNINTGKIFAHGPNANNLDIEFCTFYRSYFLATSVYNDINANSTQNIVIKNNTFVTSSSQAINMGYVTNVIIRNNTITYIKNKKNTSSSLSAIWLQNVTNCIASNNTLSHISAAPSYGLYVQNSTVNINSNSITNYGTDAIFVSSSSGVINNNTITQGSTGINISSSNYNLDGNTVSNCTSRGIFIHGICIDTLNNNIIKYCSKGLETNQVQLEISNSSFTNNSTCGLEIKKSQVNMYNCLVANNSGSFGSAIYALNSKVNITNATITNNADASSTYAPLFYSASDGNIINTIIWGNVANSVAKQVSITENIVQPSFYNCVVQLGTPQFVLSAGVTFTGAYSASAEVDPLITTPTGSPGSSIDALGGTIKWYLQTTSPAINGGLTTKNPTLTDKNGNSRVLNGIIDIGAYETRIVKTTIPGATISSATRWKNDTVIITGNINITNTGSLIIDPGVVVLFNEQYSINCAGLLKAIGTEQSKIIFKVADSTNYYKNSTNDGGWLGITFSADITETDSSILKFCDFKFLKDQISINDRNKMKIEDCSFKFGNPYPSRNEFLLIQNSIIELNRNTFSNIKNFNYLIVNKFSNINYSGNNFISNSNFTLHLLSFKETDFKFVNNSIINNSPTLNIFDAEQTKCYIVNNIIANNTANALVYNIGSTCYIANNTITKNSFSSGFITILENALVENNIVVNNIGNSISGKAAFPSILKYNFIDGSINAITSSNNIINSFANFINPSNNIGVHPSGLTANWQLSVFSEAINKGNSDISNLPTTDYDGNSRVNAGTVDMGAYENQGVKSEITTQPEAQELCVGSTLTISVVASDTAKYRWKLNGLNIPQSKFPSALKSSLIIPNVSPKDQGNYTCDVSNGFGLSVSEQAYVTIKIPPTIVTPENRFITSGSNVSITAAITGTDSIIYQWYRNNVAISGQTTSTLTISNFISSNNGLFKLTATNDCGSITSGSFSLNVNPIANVTGTPCIGQNLTLTASSGYTTYQWKKDGVDISGATNNSFDLASITTSDDGVYSCYVGNSLHGTETNPIIVSVKQAPEIVSQPSSSLVTSGSAVKLAVSATGTTPFAYQWYDDGVLMGGALASSITIPTFNASKEGKYSLNITNFCGSDVTDDFSVYLEPKISVKNNDTLYCKGEKVVLIETDNYSATYQWYKDGLVIAGATNDSLVITSAALSDVGTYHCLVTSAFGIKTTNSKSISVSELPSIVLHPSSQWAALGSTFDVQISTSGSSPITYQWYKNAAALGGGTDDRYIITSFASSDTGLYYCRSQNACGSANSENAYIYLTPQIVITNNNGHTIPCEGDNVTLNASSGNGATYQWYKDGAKVSLQTSESLVLSGITSSNAGNYFCVVTKSGQSKETETRTIAIQSVPEILLQPESQLTSEGEAYTIEISAQGSKPFNYQWYGNDTLLSVENSSRLLFAGFKKTDEKVYKCIVSNLCGKDTSDKAALMITPRVSIATSNGEPVVCENTSVSFYTNAAFNSTYQWYKEGQKINSAISKTLTINNVNASSAGNFSCVVTNIYGQTTTSPIFLQVLTKPTISADLISKWVELGSSYSLSPIVEGSKPFVYKWYKNNSIISNDTVGLKSFTSFAAGDTGRYYCKISNNCGSMSTSTIKLTLAPELFSNYGSDICENDTFELSVLFNEPASYLWTKDSKAISGQTGSVLRIPATKTSDLGNYQCKVSNKNGVATVGPVLLQIKLKPQISSQPANVWVDNSYIANYSVVANGEVPLSYNWYKNGVPISGASGSTINLKNIGIPDEAKYYCKVTNECGSISSSEASLSLVPQICMVTNDTETGKNLITWDRKTTRKYKQYNIYREGPVRNLYVKIGTVPFDVIGVWVDTLVNSKEQAFVYKITATDSSNIETPIELCAPHKTIHLLVTKGIPSGYQLDWDSYVGFDYGSYQVYRSTDGKAFEMVHQQASTTRTWTDFNTSSNYLRYYVAVVSPIVCTPTKLKANSGPFSHSVSNLEDNRLRGMDTVWVISSLGKLEKVQVNVYPNPTSSIAKLSYELLSINDVAIEIRNTAGTIEKLIASTKQLPGTYTVTIGNELKKGVYLIKISIGNSHKLMKLVKN